MSVISRRSAESIAFPEVGIELHFERVQGEVVQVRIDAPRDLRVVPRGIAEPQASLPGEVRHEIRNELHAVCLGIELLAKQIAANPDPDAHDTLRMILDAVKRVDEHPALERPDQAAARAAAARLPDGDAR